MSLPTDDSVITEAMAQGARVVARMQRASGWNACVRLWLATGVLALFAITSGILLGAERTGSRD